VYIGASTRGLPRLSPGLSHVRGAVSLDVTSRYFTDDGRPLATAPQLAEMLGIRARTVYEWRRRGFLKVRGLDEQSRELYDAAEVARVHARPRRRQQCAA
jgi:hypothetical protein